MTSHAECSACRNSNPAVRSLKCRHRLCSRCFARCSAWGGRSGVSCPKCGSFSRHSDVTSVDVGHQQPTSRFSAPTLAPSTFTPPTLLSRSSGARSSLEEARRCQACESDVIAHKCFNCDLLMCHGCRRSHARIPVTSDHAVKDVHSLANEIAGALKVEVEGQKRSHDEIQKRLELYEK